MNTIIVGIGSEILCDDGVGIHVIRQLRLQPIAASVNMIELGTAGLSILDTVKGFERLIVIDAIQTGAKPGTIHILTGDDIARATHLGPSHEADLPTVLALGRVLGSDVIPSDVVVFAIEAEDISTFSEELTPAVAEAVPNVVEKIEELFR